MYSNSKDQKQYSRDRYSRLKAEGKCLSHPESPMVGRSPRCQKCIDRFAERYKQLKISALRAYSDSEVPKCSCCGEIDIAFLTLDHVNGGGSKHRKQLRAEGGTSFYHVLAKTGYPRDPPLRVLCMNCQFGILIGHGVCPHRTAKS